MTLDNVPRIRDVETFLEIVASLGSKALSAGGPFTSSDKSACFLVRSSIIKVKRR